MRVEHRLSLWWWRAARKARARVLLVLRCGGELVGRPAGAALRSRVLDTPGGLRLVDVRDVVKVVLDGEGGVTR